MGLRDSSRTRVTPVFDTLLARDPSGQSWLPALLALPEGVNSTPFLEAFAPAQLTGWGWGRQERSLPPPRSLLRWLIQEAVLPQNGAAKDSDETRADVPTVDALLRLRRRLLGRVGLVLCAQLAKNEKLDEPLGKVFERASVDPAECEAAIELRPLTEEVFYSEVALEIVADLEAGFEEGLEQHGSFITEALWQLTAGDWKILNSRVRHFNRLLPPPASGKRVITRGIVEQVIGRKLPV